jgi:Domain of unknown function (DUF4166)
MCLYERLAGTAWCQVHQAVRHAHLRTGPLQGTGIFRIRHGQSRVAHCLAWLLQMPAPSETAHVQLSITRSSQGEVWVRTSGKKRLITAQSEVAGGLLSERFGLLEFRFKLVIQGGAICYVQQQALLRLACLRILLPPCLAPRVASNEF